MKFYIIDTKSYDEITYIINGVDIMVDFFFNGGGEGVWSDELDAYVVSSNEFTSWKKLIELYEKLDEVLDELRDEHGANRVEDALEELGDPDPWVRYSQIKGVLKASFGVSLN